jgi:hypothetical protein
VALRQAVTSVYESNIFKKRVEVKLEAPIASIARLETVHLQPSAAAIKFEGRSERSTLTGWDSKGQVVLEIVWDGSESPEVRRQREHLFKLIGDARNKVHDAPARPSVSSAESKAGALREWATDVVKASGMEITPERVEERADIMAAMIGIIGFPKLGAPYGIDDLGQLYPSGEMPPGYPIDTFDDLYAHVVEVVGDARPVDQEIDLALDKSWDVAIDECRKNY